MHVRAVEDLWVAVWCIASSNSLHSGQDKTRLRPRAWEDRYRATAGQFFATRNREKFGGHGRKEFEPSGRGRSNSPCQTSPNRRATIRSPRKPYTCTVWG